MTPAEFNSLPLGQKKQNVARGDIVITDIGARLVYFNQGIDGMACDYSHQTGCVYIKSEWVTDIIRPSPKEQPAKVVAVSVLLRDINSSLSSDYAKLRRTLVALADHFEREAGK